MRTWSSPPLLPGFVLVQTGEIAVVAFAQSFVDDRLESGDAHRVEGGPEGLLRTREIRHEDAIERIAFLLHRETGRLRLGVTARREARVLPPGEEVLQVHSLCP